MSQPGQKPGVIRRDAVRLTSHTAQIDCGSDATGKVTGTLAVVPLLDGDHVAGFEIRCGCGAGAVVECVYDKEA